MLGSARTQVCVELLDKLGDKLGDRIHFTSGAINERFVASCDFGFPGLPPSIVNQASHHSATKLSQSLGEGNYTIYCGLIVLCDAVVSILCHW